MVIVIEPVDTKAYPRAPAINGAVHGVATTTAKAPVKNELVILYFSTNLLLRF